MEKTNKELAEILANETISISNMYMETNKVKTMDRQFWMFLHLGFYAGLKLMGKSEKDLDDVLVKASKLLEVMYP